MTNIFDRINASSPDENTLSQDSNDVPADGVSHDTDASHENGLSDGEPPSATLRTVKELAQDLLKNGSLEESAAPAKFAKIATYKNELAAVFEPLDLAVRLDAHRGIAIVVVAESAYGDGELADVWTHPLVRRQRLTLEQSLLVAVLRQFFASHEQEAGVGHRAAKFAVDDVVAQYLTYFEDSGSDSRNESRVLSLLDQLKTHGIVSEVDAKEAFVISPLIAHVANPASLASLLAVLREQTDGEQTDNEPAGSSTSDASQGTDAEGDDRTGEVASRNTHEETP